MTSDIMNYDLNDREKKVLEAVIQSYVRNAEPAGSRTIARRFELGVSAATVRNTMSDLEERGYLYHPHTSAGRIPTDLAYRFYVDTVMGEPRLTREQREAVHRELRESHTAIEHLLERAAEVLGILTAELGVAAGPSFDEAVLERLELIRVSSERLLLVLVLKGIAARTIFVESRNNMPDEAIERVGRVLNERLSGLTLTEIRSSIRDRLAEASVAQDGDNLINIFVEEADQIFTGGGERVMLGSAQMLAEQPEFSTNEKMRELLEITEKKDVLHGALLMRTEPGLRITIGGEHANPRLNDFTIVTSTYRRGALSGVIGVMGPTRMPYDKIVALVEYTSRLLDDLGTDN